MVPNVPGRPAMEDGTVAPFAMSGGHTPMHEPVHWICPFCSLVRWYSVNPRESSSTDPMPVSDSLPTVTPFADPPPPEPAAALCPQAERASIAPIAAAA